MNELNDLICGPGFRPGDSLTPVELDGMPSLFDGDVSALDVDKDGACTVPGCAVCSGEMARAWQ